MFVPTSMCFLWGGFTGLASGTAGQGRPFCSPGSNRKIHNHTCFGRWWLCKSSKQTPQDPRA